MLLPERYLRHEQTGTALAGRGLRGGQIEPLAEGAGRELRGLAALDGRLAAFQGAFRNVESCPP